MATACCNLEKNGGGGVRVARKCHDIYMKHKYFTFITITNWVLFWIGGGERESMYGKESMYRNPIQTVWQKEGRGSTK